MVNLLLPKGREGEKATSYSSLGGWGWPTSFSQKEEREREITPLGRREDFRSFFKAFGEWSTSSPQRKESEGEREKYIYICMYLYIYIERERHLIIP